MMLCGELVKSCKKLIQKTNQLFGCALIGKRCEPANVRKQNAHIFVLLDVNLVKLRFFRLTSNVVLHFHGNVSFIWKIFHGFRWNSQPNPNMKTHLGKTDLRRIRENLFLEQILLSYQLWYRCVRIVRHGISM